MHLTDILAPSHIYTHIEVSSKKRLLELLAETFSQFESEDFTHAIFEGLFTREKLGSTGLGEGVAIPHARLPDIQEAHALVFCLQNPIDFDAIDAKKVDIVFSLLVPESANEDHLSLLASVAEALHSETLLKQMRTLDNPELIYQLLIGYGGG